MQTNQTSHLTKLLYWEGYTSFEYTDIFLELIKKTPVFFDIGANIGYYSLLAVAENKASQVVAFEPAVGPLHFLKENVRINNMQSDIVVESCALSDREGEIEFFELRSSKYPYLEYNLSGENNTGGVADGKVYKSVKVKTETLDAYVNRKGIDQIDLIKIDTEGTEDGILRNATHVLSTLRPIVICETLFDTIEAELEEIMRGYGYGFYNHTPAGLIEVQTLARSHDDGIYNCFFVHPTKRHLIEPFIAQ